MLVPRATPEINMLVAAAKMASEIKTETASKTVEAILKEVLDILDQNKESSSK